MKKIVVTIICLSSVIFLVNRSSGGSLTTSNEYLGKLPGIAKEYMEKLDKKEQELYGCTNMEKAYKLEEELELLEEEAGEALEEYLTSNPITNIPFEQEADYKFTINEVWVEGMVEFGIVLIAKVTITEDVLDEWGTSFADDIWAYIKAVDKEGNPLEYVIMASYNTRGPFKANMVVEMDGECGYCLDELANLCNFEKLVFISKEEYFKNN